MKKFLCILTSLVILTGVVHKAYAMSYKEAVKNTSSKPMLLYLTAPWIDDVNDYDKAYAEAEKKLGGLYNVTKIDITTSDFKEFNETFHLYPKLPYILLYKNGMKISRYLQKDCIKSYSCIDSKARAFLH